MTLQVGFAAVTLGMAILGLGGVMAYTISRRRREIGLRIALGARLLESLLFGVRPHDAVVMASAPALLAVVALLACMAPARRAASIDPMLALRQE